MPTVLTRADQRVPDHGERPPPLTWDRAKPGPVGTRFEKDLALCTCPKLHTTILSGDFHTVAPDGTVMPSYVCPVEGCGFHEYVRLDGWDG